MSDMNQISIKPDNRLLDADGSGNLLPGKPVQSNPDQIVVQPDPCTLLSRLIAAEAEVGRLREALEPFACTYNWSIHEIPTVGGQHTVYSGFKPWQKPMRVLYTHTPTTGLLELAVAAKDYIDNTERSQFCAYASSCAEEDKEVDRCYGCNLMDKVEALPQDLKELLNELEKE